MQDAICVWARAKRARTWAEHGVWWAGFVGHKTKARNENSLLAGIPQISPMDRWVCPERERIGWTWGNQGWNGRWRSEKSEEKLVQSRGRRKSLQESLEQRKEPQAGLGTAWTVDKQRVGEAPPCSESQRKKRVKMLLRLFQSDS